MPRLLVVTPSLTQLAMQIQVAAAVRAAFIPQEILVSLLALLRATPLLTLVEGAARADITARDNPAWPLHPVAVMPFSTVAAVARVVITPRGKAAFQIKQL